jgi:hypothetical protein
MINYGTELVLCGIFAWVERRCDRDAREMLRQMKNLTIGTITPLHEVLLFTMDHRLPQYFVRLQRIWRTPEQEPIG